GAIARTLDIPILDVFEAGLEGGHESLSLGEDSDDWVWRSSAPRELAARVTGLLRRRKGSSEATKSSPLPTDSRFFPLIVHDLRTPLNVIGLSLRMIDQAIPKGNAELEEDLRFVEENFKQIERMLSQLSDYCRLFELESAGPPTEFSPERLLADVVEDRSAKPGSHKAESIRLEIQDSCPAEASLDMVRARQAIQYALNNALAAANGVGVRIQLYGGPDRLVTELRIDQAPPPSVKSVELRPQLFERLCGTAAERRGMDLAIVARISEMFGGSARFEADEGKSTRIILDWPARLA
ncbi:sensor histidine kinase, partial [Singulisphaera rosea]